MTIGLTYNNDLSRVQVALSDLPDGTVQVQRVANAAATEALWARSVVRGGSALPIVGGVGSLDDFEFFADIPNHYRTVPVDPPAGLLLPGASGDYASTPDDPALDITGDLDIRIEATADEWDSGAVQALVSKYATTGDQRAYRAYVDAAGHPVLTWSTDGTAAGEQTRTATVPLPVTSGRLAIRWTLDVDNGSTEHVVTFFTAATIDGQWTQLGDPVVTAGTTSIFASTAELQVGILEGTSEPFTGSIHVAEVRDGIDGTAVANPDFADQPGGTAGFTDPAGRVWTVNGDAQIVGIEQASITPSLAGQVWLKSIRYPALNRPVTTTEFTDPGRASRATASDIAGRGAPVGTHELRGSADFTLEVQTTTREAAGDLDVILAAGSTFFVHVPANCPIPGGYVQIGDTQQVRRTRSARSERRYTTLPCRIVAPPAPQITGTLLTAETVFRLYGDANALYAAHATGRSLLATIADPSDVVVV